MVGPESADVGPASWLEGFGAFLVLLLTVGGQAWRYLRESSKEDAPSRHMVLEAAELADMGPIRHAIQKLDRLLALEADIKQIRKDELRMLELLERLDRNEEVEREVRARLRDQRRERDE